MLPFIALIYPLSPLCVSSDVKLGEIAPTQLTMQTHLMYSFFEKINPNFWDIISNNDRKSDPCKWKYQNLFFDIGCREGILTKIKLRLIHDGNFQYAYAPPSVATLEIIKCQQRYPLATRLLPISARHIYLQINNIFGRIELQTLPPHLEELNISENRISGAIQLVSLPKNLRSISLESNKIQQSVVYYDDLPVDLLMVNLDQNKIGRVCSMHADASISSKNIIIGISDNKIF